MDADRIELLFPAPVAVCVADPSMYHGPLYAEEEAIVAKAVRKRREEFTAGRAAARRALAGLGAPPGPLARTERRAPAWPRGFVGSITHCAKFCCAVAASTATVRSLGLDAEAKHPVDDALAAMICSPEEHAQFGSLPALPASSWPKLAFSAKEAFYKCVDPVLGESLDFLDVLVRFHLDPAMDRGSFVATLLRSDITVPVPVSGRWAVNHDRVYAGATLLLDEHCQATSRAAG